MNEKPIPQQIRDVCFGYGQTHLIEQMYRYEMEEYKKARGQIKGDPYSPDNAEKLKTLQYFSLRCDALYKVWVAFVDIDMTYPFEV
ncbi:MAG: hypothetical protein WC261_11790 [Synergistaceae bacterium]|jgi:hypothetical protein